MPTEKKRINLTVSEETYEFIQKVKREYCFMHDSTAVNYLIAIGFMRLKDSI